MCQGFNEAIEDCIQVIFYCEYFSALGLGILLLTAQLDIECGVNSSSTGAPAPILLISSSSAILKFVKVGWERRSHQILSYLLSDSVCGSTQTLFWVSQDLRFWWLLVLVNFSDNNSLVKPMIRLFCHITFYYSQLVFINSLFVVSFINGF